jgi:hypothetical protein
MTVAIVEKLSAAGRRLLRLTHTLCRPPAQLCPLSPRALVELMVDPTVSLAQRLVPFLDVSEPAGRLPEDMSGPHRPMASSLSHDSAPAGRLRGGGAPAAEYDRLGAVRRSHPGAERWAGLNIPAPALDSLLPGSPSLVHPDLHQASAAALSDGHTAHETSIAPDTYLPIGRAAESPVLSGAHSRPIVGAGMPPASAAEATSASAGLDDLGPYQADNGPAAPPDRATPTAYPLSAVKGTTVTGQPAVDAVAAPVGVDGARTDQPDSAATISQGQAWGASVYSLPSIPRGQIGGQEAAAPYSTPAHALALRDQSQEVPSRLPGSGLVSAASESPSVHPDAIIGSGAAPGSHAPQEEGTPRVDRSDEPRDMPPDSLRLAPGADRLAALLRDSIAAAVHRETVPGTVRIPVDMAAIGALRAAPEVDPSDAPLVQPQELDLDIEQVIAALSDRLELEFVRTYGASGG